MEQKFHITTQSLSDVLQAIKEAGDGPLSISYSPDSMLVNPENKRVVKLFAEKHKVTLRFTQNEEVSAPLIAPVMPAVSLTAPIETENGEDADPTLADVIAKQSPDGKPEFAINKDIVSGETIAEEGEPLPSGVDPAEAVPMESTERLMETEAVVSGTEDSVRNIEPAMSLSSRRGRPLSIPKPSLALLVRNHRVITAAIIGSILFFLVGVGLLWYVPSAAVTVTVANKPIQRDLTISAMEGSSADSAKNQIALNKTEVKEQLSGTARATGKKTVGNKAKGKVTVRNFNVVSPVNMAQGTILMVLGGEGDGLQFATVAAATVPVGTEVSSTDSEGNPVVTYKPGKVDVEVESADLGVKFNQPAGTHFAVNNQSTKSIDGIAATELAGGSSQDKQVVTAADQTALLEQLKAKAETQGKQSVTQKIGQGQKLVDSSVKTAITKQSFDKQVDEEAADFKLDIESLSSANYYVEDEAKQVLKANLSSLVPEGYKLDENSIEYVISPLSLDAGSISLRGDVKATLLPNLGTASVASMIVDKPVVEVEAFFKKNESVTGVDINVQPSYYQSFNRMPPRQQNIKVTFKPQ